jgi:CHAT domain-containing protein
VSSTEVRMTDLPRRRDIEEVARHAYAALSRKESASRSSDVTGLSRTILEPIAAHLGTARVVIVADGVLQYIPFAALTIRGTRLGGDHAISYLPSASTLYYSRQLTAARARAPKLAAVLADPVYSQDDERVHARAAGTIAGRRRAGAGTVPARSVHERSAQESGLTIFDRLFATRAEAAAIRTFAGGQDVLQALDFDASRETAMSPSLADYRIVHFATHGLLNSRHPELSGLVLSLVDASGRPQNGFLQAHEIYDLKLNADLVVLSACQTALGPEIRGEGLVGLTRGFLHAGARAVVATLWRVPDAATAVLMRNFYAGMLAQNLPPAQALQEAQQTLRAIPRWSAPYYWAGFVLQGE